jgi:hypothetical protein
MRANMPEGADFAAFTSQYALRRQGTPAEQAEAILFLTAPESSFITGISLAVDGGRARVKAERSRVTSQENLGHAGGLFVALSFERERDCKLHPAWHVRDRIEGRPATQPCSDRYRRGEAHLVAAVVDAHRETLNIENLRQKGR